MKHKSPLFFHNMMEYDDLTNKKGRFIVDL